MLGTSSTPFLSLTTGWSAVLKAFGKSVNMICRIPSFVRYVARSFPPQSPCFTRRTSVCFATDMSDSIVRKPSERAKGPNNGMRREQQRIVGFPVSNPLTERGIVRSQSFIDSILHVRRAVRLNPKGIPLKNLFHLESSAAMKTPGRPHPV